jgi:PAS domain S-box-containing protein
MNKSEPKKEGQKLKKAYLPTNEFYSQVVDSLEDYAVLTTDENLIINSWNSGAERIFQYKNKEIIGKHFRTIFTAPDVKKNIPLIEIKRAAKEGRATDERWHLKKDKKLFYASGLVFPLNDLEQNCIGYVKILRDLTDKKNSEESIKKYLEELEELNIHKEKTLSVLSHDLRSPLTSMLASTTFLKSRFETIKPADAVQMLEILHISTKNMLDMLNNLVEWARIKYAAEIFTPETLNLRNYVFQITEVTYENAALKEIEIVNKIQSDIFVLADRKMLNSILQNILSNAIKYTPLGGKIIINAKLKDFKVLVEIKDNGIGISDEVLKKLFFPKVESLTNKRNDDAGAGIGLLLVKSFLDKNGGEISVKSKLNKGTSFCFTLPTPIVNPEIN